ncbi:MAG TPA: hypothetical protein VLQ93_13120, partial [Myxococcaceae bacterium]|nr:hypothetical protein [Myxococcaceae bacterium]
SRPLQHRVQQGRCARLLDESRQDGPERAPRIEEEDCLLALAGGADQDRASSDTVVRAVRGPCRLPG